MDLRAGRLREAGQATVEHIAVVVVVALLVAAAGAWVATRVRAPERPPPFVERVVEPLDLPPTSARPELGVEPRRGGVRLGRVLRRGVRVAAGAARLLATGVLAFDRGLADGAWATATALIRDPVGVLVGGGGLVAAAMEDPAGLGLSAVLAAVEYANELRGLPPQEASRRLMHDLGEASADVAVTRGKGLARRAVLRALKRRLERGGAPAPVR